MHMIVVHNIGSTNHYRPHNRTRDSIDQKWHENLRLYTYAKSFDCKFTLSPFRSWLTVILCLTDIIYDIIILLLLLFTVYIMWIFSSDNTKHAVHPFRPRAVACLHTFSFILCKKIISRFRRNQKPSWV